MQNKTNFISCKKGTATISKIVSDFELQSNKYHTAQVVLWANLRLKELKRVFYHGCEANKIIDDLLERPFHQIRHILVNYHINTNEAVIIKIQLKQCLSKHNSGSVHHDEIQKSAR